MRTTTPATQAQIDQAQGTEPVYLIHLPNQSLYFADKAMSLGGRDYVEGIIEIGNLDSSTTVDSAATVSDTRVTLNDTDDTLRAYNLENEPCEIYLWYQGTTDSDKLMLVNGKVGSSINWSEGDRTFSFSVETGVTDQLIGFAPRVADYPDLHPSADGVMWPICMGKPIRFKALMIEGPTKGRIPETFYPATVVSETLTVDNGSDFPQSTPIQVRFNVKMNWWSGLNLIRWREQYSDTYVTGTMVNDQFTISSYNDTIHTDLDFDTRPGGDPDVNDPSVAWLVDDVRIDGEFVFIENTLGGNNYVNFCYKQEGKKCWFRKPWHPQWSDGGFGGVENLLLPTATYTKIDEVRGLPTSDWSNDPADPNLGRYQTEVVEQGGSVTVNEVAPIAENTFAYWTTYGADVYYPVDKNFIYVVNNMHSDAVMEVMGYRSVTTDADPTLVPVPSSWFEVDLTDNVYGEDCTTITMFRALSDWQGRWRDDNLYVTVDSSVGENTADQIKWLIDEYSDYPSDTASFTDVATDIDNYISNFVILRQSQVMQVCSDIAWQARCALRITADGIEIVYLSKVIAAQFTFDETKVGLRSLANEAPAPEEMVTILNGNWQQTGIAEKEFYKFQNNVDKYGQVQEDRELWIYNVEQLVKYSVGFWGVRYSIPWLRQVHEGFNNSLLVETLDTDAVDVGAVSPNTIRGTVTQQGIGIPLRYGMQLATEGTTEDDRYWTGDPDNKIDPLNPKPANPADGRALVDYEIEVEEQELDTNDPTVRWQVDIPANVNRGSSFDITIIALNPDNTIAAVNGNADIGFISADSGDSLSISSITVSQGQGTASAQITGGATADITASISATGLNVEYGVNTTVIDGAGNAVWTLTPSVIVRDTVFDVAITGGGNGETLTITLTSGDPSDVLQDSGGTPITTINLDSDGNYTGQWKVVGGSGNDSAYLTLDNGSGHTDDSDQFQIIEVTAADASIDYEITDTANPGLGTVYRHNGTDWAEVTNISQVSEGDTVGVVTETSATEFTITTFGAKAVNMGTANSDHWIDTDGSLTTTRPSTGTICYLFHRGPDTNNAISPRYEQVAGGSGGGPGYQRTVSQVLTVDKLVGQEEIGSDYVPVTVDNIYEMGEIGIVRSTNGVDESVIDFIYRDAAIGSLVKSIFLDATLTDGTLTDIFGHSTNDMLIGYSADGQTRIFDPKWIGPSNGQNRRQRRIAIGVAASGAQLNDDRAVVWEFFTSAQQIRYANGQNGEIPIGVIESSFQISSTWYHTIICDGYFGGTMPSPSDTEAIFLDATQTDGSLVVANRASGEPHNVMVAASDDRNQFYIDVQTIGLKRNPVQATSHTLGAGRFDFSCTGLVASARGHFWIKNGVLNVDATGHGNQVHSNTDGGGDSYFFTEPRFSEYFASLLSTQTVNLASAFQFSGGSFQGRLLAINCTNNGDGTWTIDGIYNGSPVDITINRIQ